MSLKQELYTALATLITVAFGLVAALAWNTTIEAILKSVLGTADSIPGLLTYAIVVTIIAVIAVVLIARAAARAGAEVKEKAF
jgi:TRAP-type C4-dicarboxylate transport system permease small subunit